MRATKISFVILATLFGGSALAADPALDAVRRCKSVTDNLLRLTCFDRALADESAAAPTPAAVAPPAPVSVVVAPRTLGDENLRSTEAQRNEKVPTSLTATVTARKETRKDVFRFTLDNGQIWQQMDLEAHFNVEVGDAVAIERGRMGGYRMALVSDGGRGWARVSRLK